MTEDDEVKMFDLSAWEAPPAPGGLADAVLARMAGADAVAVEAPATRRPRWVFPAAVAGALAASVALWLGLHSSGTADRGPDE